MAWHTHQPTQSSFWKGIGLVALMLTLAGMGVSGISLSGQAQNTVQSPSSTASPHSLSNKPSKNVPSIEIVVPRKHGPVEAFGDNLKIVSANRFTLEGKAQINLPNGIKLKADQVHVILEKEKKVVKISLTPM